MNRRFGFRVPVSVERRDSDELRGGAHVAITGRLS